MNKLFQQGSYFTLISGIGWCVDFGIYTLLSMYLGVPVHYANVLSSIPAVTFVFFYATRYIFSRKGNGLSLKYKYIIYLVYQLCLIGLVSWLAKWIYDVVMIYNSDLYGAEILAKCLITPVTMICNFAVMKVLGEKL